MSEHVADPVASDAAAAAQPRGTNLTVGQPRWCDKCGNRFLSGNQLHIHLKECKGTIKHDSQAAVQQRKRKHEPLPSNPETYEDAVNAPKRRRFVHHGLAGDVDAVEVGGTFFYNTAPRASPHRTWHRPRTSDLGHQASATTGSGHQASATNSASATPPASANCTQAPATSSQASATSPKASATSDCVIC